ncbi:MAG: hypothetical protein COB04_19565 [Gammaproteobacteria bacterium]|nr:MAG: hypothetical protein COB04_19565 [Gammaproteobacteria bacterium]
MSVDASKAAFRETELDLERWGRWSRASGINLGYGNCVFSDASEDPDNKALALMSDEQAEDVEAGMVGLREVLPLAYKVALLRYVRRRTLLEISRKLDVSHDRVKREKDYAVTFIMGKLYVYTVL